MFKSVFLFMMMSFLGTKQVLTGSFSQQEKKSSLSQFLNEKKWNELFPHRYNIDKAKIDFYSFKALEAAAKHFPLFLNEGDVITRKRELAAFLANIAMETGGGWKDAPGGYFKWGLYFLEEKGCENGCLQYSDTVRKKYPPVNGKSYHGRGPVQLSWNYNYGQFSEAYFGNKDSLLNHPEIISQNAEVAFASAIWFWTTAQFPKPSCHDIITNKWVPDAKDSVANRLPGFGAVLNVINGGIECGGILNDKTKYRYLYYQYFCKYFNVPPGNNAECSTQKPFGLQ